MKYACCFILLLAVTPLTHADEAAVRQLHAVFEEAWQRDLKENPTAATYLGDERYNAYWPDLSRDGLIERNRRDREFLDRVTAISPQSLPTSEQLNRDLFLRTYANRVALFDFDTHHRPLDQLNYSGSLQTLSELPELMSFKTKKDYEDWIARLRAFPKLADQVIALARSGLSNNNVQPKIIMERTLGQVRAQIVEPAQSPFYAPFKRMPESLSEADRKALGDAGLKAVAEGVIPAFRKVERMIAGEYMPRARETVGIWDTPQGAAYYQQRVEWFTTTKITADEIHDIGQREVRRIRGEMEKIIQQVKFAGTFADFLHHLRTDPKLRYKDADELFRAYMVMAKRIDPLLTQYFGRLPRAPYGVRPIPMSTAPDTTTAYYQPASPDGKRPGYYYVNLYKPEERPKYEIPVLTIHEAVPGHHLQISLSQELGELPNFRRDFDATAFVEGWALYAESLGDEMGFYTDPYDKFGQLTYEMWRAVRLVVDTGMHHKRWTRQQAIDFFKANAAKSELDIVNEVDRYIAWPGQATAYKIGELKMKELRARATQKLGSSFDIRAFHDVVLGSGALPLDVLERNVDAWIARQARQ